jgi:hypothetical protein
MTGRTTPIASPADRLADLLTRFGDDFNRHCEDMARYYSADFTAVVGDDAVGRSDYLASITTMYGAGARDIRFDVDLRRDVNADLILASGTTHVLDANGADYASRFTILCGDEAGTLRFLHVHSSPVRLLA